MLQAKKRVPPPNRTTTPAVYRKRLDYLYARRSTIDALIQSLEAYESWRSRPLAPHRCKAS